FEYPFGIGDGCFRPGFNLTCRNHSTSAPGLFLGDGTIEVTRIDMNQRSVYIKSPSVVMGVDDKFKRASLIDLENWPYSFELYVVGCSAMAKLVDLTTNKTISTCLSICAANDSSLKSEWSNINNRYCTMNLWSKNLTALEIQLTRIDQTELHLVNTTSIKKGCYRDDSFALTCNTTSNPPTLLLDYLYIVNNISLEEGQLELEEKGTFSYIGNSTRPFVFFKGQTTVSWVIELQLCEDAKKNTTTFACVDAHSSCIDTTITNDDGKFVGYRCKCWQGYQGNPYMPNGCTDINECSSPEKYLCYGICTNTDGGYTCTCAAGTYDVKSSNVLLDDHLTAKISDFGSSRLIPLDQTHLITGVQGTFGYLDPEYYQTSQLTEKSDVYSFGVILLELLTGKKPIFSTEYEHRLNLSMHFLQTVRANRPFDLIDDLVMKEATEEELIDMIGLVEMCLRLKGVKRPTMKEVEDKLQNLRRIRLKKTGHCLVKGDEETEHLPRDSPYAFSEVVDPANQGTSRNYTLEKEFMWSHHHPR
ncbi:unnamed protein product, partial [Musa hybrid cultivar]